MWRVAAHSNISTLRFRPFWAVFASWKLSASPRRGHLSLFFIFNRSDLWAWSTHCQFIFPSPSQAYSHCPLRVHSKRDTRAYYACYEHSQWSLMLVFGANLDINLCFRNGSTTLLRTKTIENGRDEQSVKGFRDPFYSQTHCNLFVLGQLTIRIQ